MGIFEQFPYANMHEMNLDWLLNMMKKLDKAMETFKATESLKFADPIIWDITTQYAKSTIVLDPTGNAYLSLQPVSTGIQLNNDEYWLEIFNFTDYTRTANQNLTVNTETNTTRATAAYQVDDWLIWNDVLYKVTSAIAIDDALIVAPAAGSNIVHFTVEDFIKAFITYATGLIQQYKNDIDASELAYRNQLSNDITTAVSSLEAQLEAAIAGATVDSEVINARIGADNITYTTLGDAIRSQFTNAYKNMNRAVSGLADGDARKNFSWHYGYIDGSSGVLNNLSYTNANRYSDLLYLNKGSLIKRENYSQYTHIYEYASDNSFIGRYAVLDNGLSTAFVVIDHDGYYRINQALTAGDATATFETNNIISVTKETDYGMLTELIKGNSIIKHNRWENGYISGSDGSEGMNTIDARTKEIAFIPKGSVLHCASGYLVRLHFYNNGIWFGSQPVSDGYIATEDIEVRIVFNGGGATITTLETTKLDSCYSNYYCYFETNSTNTFTVLSNIIGEFYKPNYSKYETITDKTAKCTFPVTLYAGHQYLARFKSDRPLNQNSFYLQMWGSQIYDPGIGTLLRNFGDIWSTNDTSNWLTYLFTVNANMTGWFRFGYALPIYKDAYVQQELYDLNSPEYYDELKNDMLNINARNNTNYWKGRHIAWFGTSIPAGGYDESYPKKIGRMLDATVDNNSIGSSAARIGNHNNISASDPNGYAGVPATCCLLSLSGTRAEKQDILDNWAYWSTVFTQGVGSIDTSNPNKYLNSSYETILDQYLYTHGGWPADLYVFDHGFNDAGNDNTINYSDLVEIPANPLDRTYFIGAMNFLIDRIKTDNYQAKIVIISHYNDEGIYKDLINAQKYIADKWNIPFINISNKLGFSTTVSITINGTTKTMKDWYLPDGIHPASDTTGYALEHYAEVLFPEIRDVR